MKKIIAVVLFICLVGTGVFFYINSHSKQGQDTDIQALFTSWDKGEVEDSEKTKIIEALMDYVSKNPQASIEADLQALSNHISVFEAGNFSMIQYIENPEFYGSSGRESYHFVVYNGQLIMIDSKGSMRIDEIIKRDDNLYIVYATDYRMSNITGVQIFNIEIDDRTINQRHIINKDDLGEKFVYDDVSNILYYDNGHIYFKEIRDNGNEILITAGDTDFFMRLDQDELYRVSPIN